MSESTATVSWVKSVEHFWFSEIGADVWFKPNAAIDESIRTRFLAIHEQVVADFSPTTATSSADRAVASVIVLDQFPRNMFRGTPRAFATDHFALAVAREAIERGFDNVLDKHRRLFMYLPFEHSENLYEQHRAVELIGILGDSELLHYALAHRDIIARFGRFPHRNAILGRASTPEEVEFLKQPDSAF
jgi:uncharacterized protein (DUF924 family)